MKLLGTSIFMPVNVGGACDAWAISSFSGR